MQFISGSGLHHSAPSTGILDESHISQTIHLSEANNVGSEAASPSTLEPNKKNQVASIDISSDIPGNNFMLLSSDIVQEIRLQFGRSFRIITKFSFNVL